MSPILIGFKESDLGDDVARSAKQWAVAVGDDPEPQRNRFIRSDQFSFVRKGVPGVNILFGAEKGSAEADTLQQWTRERYHAPSDDPNQPINLVSAALYTRILETVIADLANADKPPQWKSGSFFQGLAASAPKK